MQIGVTKQPRPRAFLGVDVGGTNTKFAVVGNCGSVLAREVISTGLISSPREACQCMLEIAEEFSMQYRLQGVGVAVPGILDWRRGVLREVANLPLWNDFPLRDELNGLFDIPVAVVNDANAAAVAEHAHRELGNEESLAIVTLGTGIGCGVVHRGAPMNGDHGCGGEIGHAVVDFAPDARTCGCGKRGHLESYSGARAVTQRARERLALGENSALAERLHRDELSPRVIAEEAEQGDALCQSVVQEAAQYVGIGVSLLCQVLDPSVVVLGGAMTFGAAETATGRGFLAYVTDTVRRSTLPQVGDNIIIEFASLGSDAGVLGAAAVARRAAKQDHERNDAKQLLADQFSS